jgi:hypothetical protein
MVEYLHDAIIRMMPCGVMGFIEYQQSDMILKGDKAMRKSIEQDLRCRDDATVGAEQAQPDRGRRPLLWFLSSGNEDCSWESQRYDIELLLAECDSRTNEPGDLVRGQRETATYCERGHLVFRL